MRALAVWVSWSWTATGSKPLWQVTLLRARGFSALEISRILAFNRLCRNQVHAHTTEHATAGSESRSCSSST